MSHFVSNRQRQSRGRRALGLFVALWLNLALQPCAMAYEADEHDCAHCPPAETHAHGDRHQGMAGEHHEMDHEASCADGMADCMIDAEWSHDPRGTKSKPGDTPTDSYGALVATDVETHGDSHASANPEHRHSRTRAGAPLPLHVLFCVYLD